MKLYNILYILILILIISSASAQDQYFKNGDVGQIIFLCQNNDSPCLASINCNITIYYPDNTLFINNQPTYRGGTDGRYIYNLSASQTSINGIYTAISVCYNSSTQSSGSFNYKITSTGDDVNSLSQITIIIILLVLAIIFMVVGITFNNEKWIIKSGLFGASLFVMITAVGMGGGLVTNNHTSKLMTNIFIITISTLVLFMLYLIINYFTQSVRQIKNSKKEDDE